MNVFDYLKTCYFPVSVLVAGQGRKGQLPFEPRLPRKPLLQQNEEQRLDVPRLPRKRLVQQDEAEVEHDGPETFTAVASR